MNTESLVSFITHRRRRACRHRELQSITETPTHVCNFLLCCVAKNVAPRTPLESHRRPVAVPRFKSKSECLIRGRTLDHKIKSLALYRQLSAAETPTPVTFSLLSGMMCPLHRWKATGVLLLFRETQGTKGGDAGNKRWRRRVSIPVPLACEASALPCELRPPTRGVWSVPYFRMGSDGDPSIRTGSACVHEDVWITP
jgi:hypothetical protein